MSNYNLKAKSRFNGMILNFTAIDHVYDYSYIQEDFNFTLTSKEFNELYEVMSDTCQEHVKTLHVDPNHPYGGMEVMDNVPKETWRDRLRSHEFTKFDDETFEEQVNYEEIETFFQQELERIKNNFMTEFTDPDTGLLNISKYDHEEITNFFNKEIK